MVGNLEPEDNVLSEWFANTEVMYLEDLYRSPKKEYNDDNRRKTDVE